MASMVPGHILVAAAHRQHAIHALAIAGGFIALAITSRLTRVLHPCVPEMPSLTVMVPNICGMPPA